MTFYQTRNSRSNKYFLRVSAHSRFTRGKQILHGTSIEGWNTVECTTEAGGEVLKGSRYWKGRRGVGRSLVGLDFQAKQSQSAALKDANILDGGGTVVTSSVVPATLVSNANNGVRSKCSSPSVLTLELLSIRGYRLVNRCSVVVVEGEATGKRRSKLSSRSWNHELSEEGRRSPRIDASTWPRDLVRSRVTGGAVSGSSGRMRSRCHVRVSAFNRRIRTVSGAMRGGKVLERSGQV